MTRLIIILLTLPLAGCGLDILEGKPSDFQVAQERREALAMPVVAVAAVEPVTQPTEPEPQPVVAVVQPEPAVVPVAPCQPVYRVWACVDGVRVEL